MTSAIRPAVPVPPQGHGGCDDLFLLRTRRRTCRRKSAHRAASRGWMACQSGLAWRRHGVRFVAAQWGGAAPRGHQAPCRRASDRRPRTGAVGCSTHGWPVPGRVRGLRGVLRGELFRAGDRLLGGREVDIGADGDLRRDELRAAAPAWTVEPSGARATRFLLAITYDESLPHLDFSMHHIRLCRNALQLTLCFFPKRPLWDQSVFLPSAFQGSDAGTIVLRSA